MNDSEDLLSCLNRAFAYLYPRSPLLFPESISNVALQLRNTLISMIMMHLLYGIMILLLIPNQLAFLINLLSGLLCFSEYLTVYLEVHIIYLLTLSLSLFNLIFSVNLGRSTELSRFFRLFLIFS